MSLAVSVESAIGAAGAAFGGRLTGTLTRRTTTTGPDYEPTKQNTESYSFVALWGEFTAEERMTGLIQDDDHRLEVGAHTLAIEPRIGDQVTVGGNTYDVHHVEVVQPAGAPILYRLRLRG